jgi:hypothetical protein
MSLAAPVGRSTLLSNPATSAQKGDTAAKTDPATKAAGGTAGTPPAIWTDAPAASVGQHSEHTWFGNGLDLGATLLGVGAFAAGFFGAPFTGGASIPLAIAGGALLLGAGGTAVGSEVLNNHWSHKDGAALPQRSIVRDVAPHARPDDGQLQAEAGMERGSKPHGSIWVEGSANGKPMTVLDYAPQQHGADVGDAQTDGLTRAKSYSDALYNARTRALAGESVAIEQLANGQVWEQTISKNGDAGKPGQFGTESLHTSDPSIKAVVTPSGVYT